MACPQMSIAPASRWGVIDSHSGGHRLLCAAAGLHCCTFYMVNDAHILQDDDERAMSSLQQFAKHKADRSPSNQANAQRLPRRRQRSGRCYRLIICTPYYTSKIFADSARPAHDFSCTPTHSSKAALERLQKTERRDRLHMKKQANTLPCMYAYCCRSTVQH